jgi:hypothetical protein
MNCAIDCISCGHPEADHQWEARRHGGLVQVGKCSMRIPSEVCAASVDAMLPPNICPCDGYNSDYEGRLANEYADRALEQIMIEWGWCSSDSSSDAKDFTRGDYDAARTMVIEALRVLDERAQITIGRLPKVWQKRW